MRERLPPLTPEALRALGGLREPQPAPPAVRARLRARLRASLAPPSLPTVLGAPKLALLGVGLLAVVLTSSSPLAGAPPNGPPASAPARHGATTPLPHPASARDAPAPVVRPANIEPVAPSAPEPPAPATHARRMTARPVPDHPPAAEDDVSEHALLEDARTALRDHETGRALTLLEAHAIGFPTGVLAEEREALLVRTLLASGRRREARERGARFLETWPTSIFRDVVAPALAAAE